MNIEEKSRIAKVIFLVGAGISVPIGIPTMRGLYLDFLKQSKSNITSSERYACKYLTEQLGVNEDLEDFLLITDMAVDFRSSRIARWVERAVSSSDGTKKLFIYRSTLDRRTDRLKAVRRRLMEYLSKTCFRFNRDVAYETYSDFVAAVAHCGYPVFTTNYDFGLEHAATEKGLSIHDNFVSQGQRSLWNKKIEFPIAGGLTLVKLHGSVTWYADDEGVIERLPNYTTINSAGRDASQLMIFPTRFKDIYEQHFFALYSHFLGALSNAQILIVSGNSLRDEYIRAGLIERFRKGNITLIVIDPEYPKTIEEDIPPTKLGKAGNVIHVPLKFEEFSGDLSRLLLTYEPSEIAARCAEIVRHIASRTNKVAIKGKIGKLKSGETKRFRAHVEAYLPWGMRPSRLRVWVNVPDMHQKSSSATSKFLDKGDMIFGESNSGMINQEREIEIRVPKNADWDGANKVSLNVALVKDTIPHPNRIGKHSIVALGKRSLTYSIR